MKLKSLIYLFLWIPLIFLQCQKDGLTGGDDNNGGNQNITYGKNRFITRIDGDDREYWVHIPNSYTGKTEVPMVFMLHGTSGDGEEFYNHSGWREVGDAENIITVYPSSWRYCIHTDGETKTITKWNTVPDCEWTYCDGQKPRDDIKFLSAIITEMGAKYKIDDKRIYLVGFSNGGQMAARCSIELSDKLAAIVESAGSFYLDTTYTPKRKLPVLYQIGNEDYGPGNVGPAIPLSLLDTLITTPGIGLRNGKHYVTAQDHIRDFKLDPNFILSGDTTKAAIATYKPISVADNHQFLFVLIKGLKHAYPNGENHPMEAAVLNWAWMKNFSL
ncbi:MAG: hypothetical protein IPI77_08340 [Saprospiraceae bacterium]|nr:hypothetical protein [Saprospiraceae bacterium]